ncbi:MAG: hypothetical protein FWD66_08615 [Paludibacter sp.]|nr:hypothetical protein [Paludibacter sp.]
MNKIFTKAYYERKYLQFLKKKFPKKYKGEKLFYDAKQRFYYQMRGKKLSYHNPKTLSEKIHWLSRYWYQFNPIVIQCADKYAVRDYVKKCGYEDALVPLLGIWDKAEDIDFETLPQKFVLKCNHGSGYNIIVEDKLKLDIKQTKQKLNCWLNEKFGLNMYEFHYQNIKPKIICEKYLEFSDFDYKYYCINGKPNFILVVHSRNFGDKSYALNSYSLDWEEINVLFEPKISDIAVSKPSKLTEMTEMAQKLSAPFPFVRTDFYYVDDKIYFSELTFTPNSGLANYLTSSYDRELGKKLELPQKLKK